ncbi:MAG TPA: hypothetical protein VJY62_13115 [Bacteroidia bacterium]|nr:hypothetical protein [Bacteroidia bacterium]
MKTTGGILVIIGLLMIVFTSINFKTKEKVVDLGPIEVNKEKDHKVNWPPVLGAVLLVGGVVIMVMNKKK